MATVDPHTVRAWLAGTTSEIAELEGSIADLQRKLEGARGRAEHLHGLLALCGDIEAHLQQSQPGPASPAEPDQATHASMGNEDQETAPERPWRSKKEALRTEVTELLRREGRLHRAKILEHLVREKIMGHEKDPLAALAAYLSDNRDLFEPDGRGNFSLRPKPPNARENEAAEGFSTFADDSQASAPQQHADIP